MLPPRQRLANLPPWGHERRLARACSSANVRFASNSDKNRCAAAIRRFGPTDEQARPSPSASCLWKYSMLSRATIFSQPQSPWSKATPPPHLGELKTASLLGADAGQGASFSALPGAVFTILARTCPLATSMTVTLSPALS